VRIGVSVALAALSFYAVERPIRAGTLRLPKPKVVVVAAASALVVALVVSTAGGGDSVAARTERALRQNAPAPQAAAPSTAATGANGATAAAPTVPPKLMVVGDSVAGTMALGFQDPAFASQVTVWNRGRLGCGLFYDGSVFEGGVLTPVDPECNWRESWPAELQEFKPDLVVMLVGAWDILDREVGGHVVQFGSVEYDTSFLHQLDDATTLLASTGAKVVILTTPFFSRPDLAIQTGRQWPEYEPWRVDRINSLYRDFLASHPGRYELIDLNHFVSPNGKFTDTLDGQLIRDDGVHFTTAGQQIVAKWLVPQLLEVAKGGDPDPTDNEQHSDGRHLWAK
jgi:hypothetical protein